MALRYWRVYHGEFGYEGDQPIVRVGRRALLAGIDGLRAVVGTNGSTRFRCLDRRPARNGFPVAGTPVAVKVMPPYHGERGPRAGEWGVLEEETVTRHRRQDKGARRTRRHFVMQLRQRRAFA